MKEGKMKGRLPSHHQLSSLYWASILYKKNGQRLRLLIGAEAELADTASGDR